MNPGACMHAYADAQWAFKTNPDLGSTIMNYTWFFLGYALSLSPLILTVLFPETVCDTIDDVM